MRVPKRRGEELERASREQDNYMTPAKRDRLRQTLRDIEEKQLPQAREDLRVAREMGDLSENAAYSEAKGRTLRLTGRIHSINERIRNAILIEKGSDDGKVSIGCTVTVTVNGKQRVYEVLGSQETAPSDGRISYKSPLGAALLGHSAGDEVTVETNGRKITYHIDEVE
jgi:transcription elongation factor GreA